MTDNISKFLQLFGDNRAEWPQESFQDLFVTPAYQNKLESLRPSILVGGRGTGKTTALQSLRYTETLNRLERDGQNFGDQEYLGVLVRMNKNRVHAFKGEAAQQIFWNKSFGHYFNLLVCLELTKLAIWLENKNEISIDGSEIERISIDLGIGDIDSFIDLQQEIKRSISKLQLLVNNPNSDSQINFSIPESPVVVFVEVLQENGALGNRTVFCCIDEYENLLDYQQAILNTYIKHSEPPLSYKVGVRKNGFRNRQTTDGNDLLNVPDDYAEIEIADEGFNYFATEVANQRLYYANKAGVSVPKRIDKFLDDLSISEEAIMLGAEQEKNKIMQELSEFDEEVQKFLNLQKPSDIYFLKFWQEKENADLGTLATHWMNNESVWAGRMVNHGYASLFWLSKGKKGRRIRKYYSGHKTLLNLSGGNIRYFLEIIDAAIKYELKDNSGQLPENFTISPKSQTLALKDVGKRRLDQLEGLADHGVQLKRLVLTVGKVFFELARSPENKSPETNSFILSGSSEELEKLSELLRDGVGHLAFECNPRTKDTSSVELKDDEYRLHRIFSSFFEISHRKKRRTTFAAKDLLAAVNGRPSKAITELLGEQSITDEDDLPEQLAFFSAFYDGNGVENA